MAKLSVKSDQPTRGKSCRELSSRAISLVRLTGMYRRITTFLLLLVFFTGPVFSTLVPASISSDLPDCCKKNGVHLCSVRRTQGKQEDAKAKLFAYCPFAGKGTLAVPGQRVGNVVEANSVFAPLAASDLVAKALASTFASTFFLPNSKRGPPSTSFRS